MRPDGRGAARHPATAVRAGPAARGRRRGPSPSPGRGTPVGCVRIGGLTVLTDPVWSRRILGTPARITPVGVRWEDLPPRRRGRHQPQPLRPPGRPHPEATPARTPRCSSRPASAAGSGAAASPGSPSWTGGRRRNCRRTGRPLRLRPRPPLVQAHPHRHLPLAVGRLGAHRRRDGQRVYFAGDTGYGHWFARDRPPLPRHRPGAAADRRVRPALVAQRRAHRPGGGGAGLRRTSARARMAPMHWATFVLSAEPVAGTADPGAGGLGAAGPAPRATCGTCRSAASRVLDTAEPLPPEARSAGVDPRPPGPASATPRPAAPR